MEVTDSKEVDTCTGRHIHASRVLDAGLSLMPAGSMAARLYNEVFFRVLFLLHFFIIAAPAGSMAAGFCNVLPFFYMIFFVRGWSELDGSWNHGSKLLQ